MSHQSWVMNPQLTYINSGHAADKCVMQEVGASYTTTHFSGQQDSGLSLKIQWGVGVSQTTFVALNFSSSFQSDHFSSQMVKLCSKTTFFDSLSEKIALAYSERSFFSIVFWSTSKIGCYRLLDRVQMVNKCWSGCRDPDPDLQNWSLREPEHCSHRKLWQQRKRCAASSLIDFFEIFSKSFESSWYWRNLFNTIKLY